MTGYYQSLLKWNGESFTKWNKTRETRKKNRIERRVWDIDTFYIKTQMCKSMLYKDENYTSEHNRPFNPPGINVSLYSA